MPAWDREDMIARFRQATRRPRNDRELDDAAICRLLSEAQDHWHRNLCAHVPHIHWAEPAELVSSDGGRSWTLPGATEFVGPIQLRHGRPYGSIIPPDQYILDGVNARIRIPFDAGWSFTPFIRAALPLDDIRPSTDVNPSQPTLRPASARSLVVYHAAELFAQSGGLRDPSPYVALQQKEWLGDPNLPGAIGILETLKLQYMHHEAELAEQGGGIWYRSPDLY